MELSDYVKEFRTLQKTQKIRVADFCRERMLDYYEMVEALKRDKFLSELPEEQFVAGDLEVTDLLLALRSKVTCPICGRKPLKNN